MDTLTLEVEGGIFFKMSGIAKLLLSIKTKMASILNINVMENLDLICLHIAYGGGT